MSKSKLRNKFIRSWWYEPVKGRKTEAPFHNPHRQDECPKNKPSKYISMRCDDTKVHWLQEPVNFGGHKPRRGGHRMVSGIVRAKVKREIAKEITYSLADDGK